MRRVVVVLALLAMTLPIAAWADDITLVNKYGSIAISDSGITTKGSELIAFNGIQAPKNHSLGTVSYTTGALTSGTILGGGTFSSTGSSFLVIGKGNYGQPKGTIFSGSFFGPISWTLVSKVGTTLTYDLTGTITGTLYTGRIVSGTTTQVIYSTAGQITAGIGHIKIGNTQLTVPEPGTLGLLGTGLVGIAGMFRRKLMGS